MNRTRIGPWVIGSLGLLLVGGRSPGFIDAFRPETLGSVCERAQSITVLKVEKFSKEKGVIVFKKVKDLKGKLPRDGFRERLTDAHEPHEREHYLSWVGEGKTAVIFRYENRQAICIGEQWTVSDGAPPKDGKEVWTIGTRTEPWFNKTYFGDAEKLPALVSDILGGKEVVVPAMLGDRDKELRQRKGKAVRLKASLKRKDYDPKRDAADAG